MSCVSVRGDQNPQGECGHERIRRHNFIFLWVWPVSLLGLSKCLFSLWEEKDSLASRNRWGQMGTQTATDRQESEARRAPQSCCCCCCCRPGQILQIFLELSCQDGSQAFSSGQQVCTLIIGTCQAVEKLISQNLDKSPENFTG